jgi:hypothetical protein
MAQVYIILDASRALHVAPVGFLTPPAELWTKLHAGGIKLCTLADAFPG